MAGRVLVINEWLVHDLAGDNGPQAQREAVKLLEILIDKCDLIAVIRPSRWAEKAGDVSRQAQPGTTVRECVRLLWGLLRDSKKTIWKSPEECAEFPAELDEAVPLDDRYLVKLYLCAGADLLITADRVLHNALKAGGRINVRLRDDFLREYIR